MRIDSQRGLLRALSLAGLLTASLLLLAGCGSSSEDTTTQQQGTTLNAPAASMAFPDSLTGGAAAAPQSTVFHPLANGNGPNCNFAGAGAGNDPFRNGYLMTKFLVGSVAQWQCFTDFLVSVVSQLAAAGQITTDGALLTIPADPNDPGGPTAISVTADSATQTTVRLYFNDLSTTPGVYFSWNTNNGTTQGKLVIGTAIFNDPTDLANFDPEAPTDMRMDLNYGSTTQTAQMYLAFNPTGALSADYNNPWAKGFRIDATKTLADGSFAITGLLEMKRQFDGGYALYGSEIPSLAMKTVSDAAGAGAAYAQMNSVAVSFPMTAPETLGYYLFDKLDKYYFTSTGGAEWIDKSVATATYKGGKNLVTTTDANIDTFLGLTSGTTAGCQTTDSDCVTLLNVIFNQGYFGADLNSTAPEPSDSRNTALSALTYLTQSTPDTSAAGDWTGVFDRSFTPTN